ncbi:MAG TPA: apolipoprotein N-acyltransferase [Bacteroidota bacterium]|nr:apolipoprotein N-acyltransferase [Bacteroidota bacterium]
MNNSSGRRELSLALLAGCLLGFSFPPVPTGIFAAVAFVPFFLLLEGVQGYGAAIRRSYVTFFVFNVITLYWTGGFTHGKDPYLMAAGASLLLVHPLFFYVPVAGWIFIRKRFGGLYSLCLFPFLWVSFEYLHSLTEISFPWLTLGNSQTYDLASIQIASLTGVFGISFWLLWLNVAVYLFFSAVTTGRLKFLSVPSAVFAAGILALYLLPGAYGASVLRRAADAAPDSIRVGVVQPNIDPFEKWEQRPDLQLQVLERLTWEVAGKGVDLIIWPETAVPFYILDPRNRPGFETLKREIDSLGIPLLTGIPDIKYYGEGEPAPGSSKVSQDGRRYDNYNSSMLLQPGDPEIQKYAKMILVPFAERVPFSEALSFLNAMQWNFGLGGWGMGSTKTVFHLRGKRFAVDSSKRFLFSNFICYESVYPGFVASFVREGAEFLTVITNDSWWGNTSGAYQHAQFAVLRAVENRRWVVQCANGGISCFVDPFGHLLEPTRMFTQQVLISSVKPERALTFYSAMGDWFAQICLVLSSFSLAAALGSRMYSTIRGR